MTPIPLMVELCAGTAALSLRLARDGAKPPVSRQGAKTGYANAILRILGLAPGQGAAAYLWCEPDPGVRLLLEAYRSAPLARAAAAIIRGWAAEDPRALWERLRAEGPPRLPEDAVDAGEVARWLSFHRLTIPQAQVRGAGPSGFNGGKPQGAEGQASDLLTLPTLPAAITPDAREVDPSEVARWVWTWGRSYNTKGPDAGFMPSESSKGTPVWNAHPPAYFAERMSELPTTLPAAITPDAREVDPGEVARWLQIVASNRLINTAWSTTEGRWINTGDGGATFGGAEFCSPPERTAAGLDGLPVVGAVVSDDARRVDPAEVARWAHIQGVGVNGKGVSAGFGGWERPFKVHGEVVRMLRQDGHPDVLAPRLDVLPTLPAAITPDARAIEPGRLPPGTVAYMDPPYVGTTGYASDLPRADVVTLARRWAAAGATVCISEAEPIPELVAEGWHAVEITGERVGAARTFSKQKREWVTMNKAPAWVPPVQGSLF